MALSVFKDDAERQGMHADAARQLYAERLRSPEYRAPMPAARIKSGAIVTLSEHICI
ncbi:hypothetical protein F2S73_02095 [Pseudomonas syringae pv. actinidiae]|nr:hypothetical protein [Pseudomonas syringae pv. actinidiae]